jgi:hypothetical protein
MEILQNCSLLQLTDCGIKQTNSVARVREQTIPTERTDIQISATGILTLKYCTSALSVWLDWKASRSVLQVYFMKTEAEDYTKRLYLSARVYQVTLHRTAVSVPSHITQDCSQCTKSHYTGLQSVYQVTLHRTAVSVPSHIAQDCSQCTKSQGTGLQSVYLVTLHRTAVSVPSHIAQDCSQCSKSHRTGLQSVFQVTPHRTAVSVPSHIAQDCSQYKSQMH